LVSREQPAGGDAGRGAGDGRFGLTELTRAAGVSVRTVRYYIAEGLLPPPVGGGPASHYTAAHLDRLRLIARLKASYLPLKEIRRRLAGLDDAAVRRLLATDQSAAERSAPEDDAAAYLDRLLGTRPAPAALPAAAPRREAWGLGEAAPPAAGAPPATGSSFLVAAADDPAAPPPTGFPPSVPMLGRAYPAAFPAVPEPEPEATEAATDAPASHPDAWRRVPLGEDAELLIREGTYRRRRDRVEWLIAWARKVFG
jgi:DNA-binding transcriptional MerR regulator